MKAETLIAFVVLVAAVCCRPDLKNLQERTSRGASCSTNIEDCSNVPYSPVCAGKPGEWPKSFGSPCALNVYNCIHKESLKIISSGKCSGSR